MSEGREILWHGKDGIVVTDSHTQHTPTPTRAGRDAGLRHTRVDSPVDELTLIADGDVLIGVYFAGRWASQVAHEVPHVEVDADPLLRRTRDQLGEYFAGDRMQFDLPLEPRGNEFGQTVWHLLTLIPYGTTTTYGAIAEQVGGRGLSQRVGQTVGSNPLSIVIPCHRVIGADGTLVGFGGGLDRKRYLLGLEEPPAESASRLF